MGLLLSGSIEQIILITLTSAAALAGFSIGAAGWITGPANIAERLAAALGGIMLMMAGYGWELVGLAVIASVVIFHLWRVRRLAAV
jgi:TRAP-type uncharacterized transport system fused permease subunit